MSLSFACPQCRAQIEVGDELVGQTGQCPRCQHVFTIPAPAAPMPIAVGKAIPVELPPEEEKRRPRWDERPRPRRVRAVPPQPRGPLWPWLVGVLGALVVGGLLFSSFLVLVVWRKPATNPPHVEIEPPLEFFNIVLDQNVTAGRFDGQRAFMNGGVFQVKTELNNNDPGDPHDVNCRMKRYEIELIGLRTYWIEMDSHQFDPLVRIEEPNGVLRSGGNLGNRNARLLYTPAQTQIVTVHGTCMVPSTGPFTLTVREQGLPKPFVP